MLYLTVPSLPKPAGVASRAPPVRSSGGWSGVSLPVGLLTAASTTSSTAVAFNAGVISETAPASSGLLLSTPESFGSAVFSEDGATCPLVFGFAAGFVRGGLLVMVDFSCVLPDDAAVGLIIRSRKLPSAAARLRRVDVCESRDLDRGTEASDDRALGLVAVACGLGRKARGAFAEVED